MRGIGGRRDRADLQHLLTRRVAVVVVPSTAAPMAISAIPMMKAFFMMIRLLDTRSGGYINLHDVECKLRAKCRLLRAFAHIKIKLQICTTAHGLPPPVR